MREENLLEDAEHFAQILGGEPTQHPQFEQFIEEASKRNIKVVLISNFLFNSDILDIVKSHIKNGDIGAFLQMQLI